MASPKTTLLTDEQQKFLTIFNKEKSLYKKFYLTGGTALSEFYLRHRLSEDLDFFSEEEFSILPIRSFIKRAGTVLNVKHIDYQNFLGLHTFFFHLPNKERLKVDFNYYPFSRISKGLKVKNIVIDSDYDIAVNKVHTIVMQPRARDFIDIYFLMREKKYVLRDLLKQAKIKFDWHIDAIQLGSRFLQVRDVGDFPRMIKKVNHREWQDFFVEEAKRLKDEIIKQ